LFLDYLADRNLKEGRRPSWKNKQGAEISELWVGDTSYLAVKPLGYMNLSGEALSRIMAFYKIPAEELIVIHDDIDLPSGSLRIKQGGGSAGHRGLESITRCLGSDNYLRLRIGVGRPQTEGLRGSVSNWVLSRFKGDDVQWLEDALAEALNALEEITRRGVVAAQNTFNRREKLSSEPDLQED